MFILGVFSAKYLFFCNGLAGGDFQGVGQRPRVFWHASCCTSLVVRTAKIPATIFAVSVTLPCSRSIEEIAYIIAEPCIGTKDTACVDACPVDCIHPKKDSEKYATEEMLYIDPVECIDCGACVPVCPVSAIFALDDLPEKWNAFTERNAKYFGR